MQSWLEGRIWVGKGAQATGMTASLRIQSSKADSNTWESFTRSGLKLESVHQESPRSDVFRKSATKPLLNQRQRQKHLTWAVEKKNWTVAQWSKVLFSDESTFCISFGNQGPRSFVQTVSPNPILCISGWNRIWITDCPHSISQLFISDLCVHNRSFVFTECALVSMVMPLRCYAYAKNNSNSNTVCNTDVVLPSRLRCSIIFRLVRQRQKCRKLCGFIPCCRLRYFPFFFFLSPLLSKHKEVRVLAVYCFFPLDLHFARHKLVFAKMFSMFSAKTSDVFMFYVAWGREKATLNPIWSSRLKRISRNAIWIGFQTTYECSSKRICTNRISCSSLPFRLSKYDRISIGFAQKSDLGWQPERGKSLEEEWRGTESMLLEVQCEVSTVSDDLGCHVICWCWSTVFSEVHSQRSHLPGNF